MKNRLLKKTYPLIAIAYFFFAFLTVLVLFFQSEKYHFYIVQSGSMKPSLPIGSFIFVQQKEKYQEGDIVTFYTQQKINYSTVTHRVVSLNKDQGGQLVYQTKGDANTIEDEIKLRPKYVVGKVIFYLPYLGLVVNLICQNNSFKTVFLVFGVIVVLKESLKIKKEVRKHQNSLS